MIKPRVEELCPAFGIYVCIQQKEKEKKKKKKKMITL